MDPEIIKAATELAKVTGTAAGLSIPFTGIVKRMLGPAADELAEMWRDQVRLYRYEHQLKCVQKAERMAEEAGFVPKAVPPKILFPLLEGASFEDDENLHDLWSALLANAASSENIGKVRPGFLATLSQMARDEAAMLNWAVMRGIDQQPITFGVAAVAYNQLGFGPVDIPRIRPVGVLENEDAQELSTCMYSLITYGLMYITQDDHYGITWRGHKFVIACRPPKPKS